MPQCYENRSDLAGWDFTGLASPLCMHIVYCCSSFITLKNKLSLKCALHWGIYYLCSMLYILHITVCEQQKGKYLIQLLLLLYATSMIGCFWTQTIKIWIDLLLQSGPKEPLGQHTLMVSIQNHLNRSGCFAFLHPKHK